MLVLDKKTGGVEHKLFKDLIEYFDEGDTFVLNNTKVFPAKCMASRRRPMLS